MWETQQKTPGLNKENVIKQQEIKADHYKGTPTVLTADLPGATMKGTDPWISILKVPIESKNCQPKLCTHKHYLLRVRAK